MSHIRSPTRGLSMSDKAWERTVYCVRAFGDASSEIFSIIVPRFFCIILPRWDDRAPIIMLMKKILTFVLLTFTMVISMPSFADEIVKIDGVYFNLSISMSSSSSTVSATILAPINDNEEYAGDLKIPFSVKYGNHTYMVRGYSKDAFVNQRNLRSLDLFLDAPYGKNGQEPLPEDFDGCDMLTNLKIHSQIHDYLSYNSWEGCVYRQTTHPTTTTLNIVPPGLSGEFKPAIPCLVIPQAFAINNKINRINLESTSNITPGFGKYRNIEGFITASYHPLYSAKDGVLYSKSGKSIVQHPGKAIDGFTIPASVDSIRSLAFAGCAIGNLTVPKKVFISTDAFDDFNGKITFEDYIPYDVIRQMAKTDALEKCTIRVHGKDLSEVKKYWKGKVEPIESFWINYEEPYYDSYRFTVTAAEPGLLNNINRVTVGGKVVEPDSDGIYEATELFPGDTYEVCVYYTNDADKESVEKYKITTKNIYYDYSSNGPETTEATATFAIKLSENGKTLTDIMSKYEFGIEVTTTDSYFDTPYFPATYSEESDLGTIHINGLLPDTWTEYWVYIKFGERYYLCKGTSEYFSYGDIFTKRITPIVDYKATPTTITIKDIVKEYGTFKADKVVIYDEHTNKEYKVKGYKIDGLRPNEEGKSDNCRVILRFYMGEYFTTCSVDLSTATLGFKSNAELLGPTVLKITPEYNRTDEVNVQRLVVGFGGEEYECTLGNPLFITGLKPETSHLYHLKAVIKDSNGEYNYFFREKYYDSYNKKYFWRQDIPINTGAVVLNTLSPKNTSSTTSIVCAETNIDDHETNVGFQWRKYDAPESLPSNKGYAAIYDGTMEGRIINLQPAFYYNVRAFYKSSDDTYYYGKWVTFDPSDFSYFEPTVHTYGVEGVTHNTAQIRGYVMAGTDEIIQQGFEYYPVSDLNQSRRKVVDIETTAASGAPNIVFSSGQIMTATLEDLAPSTTYVCRAFATTSSGTVYGEDFKFTTSEFAGIYEIEAEQNREPIGYFDLMGRRSERPHEGFNIVIYDDGTSEKFIQK